MDPVESVRMGLRTIRGHRLRSTLTVLAVVIGIAAVITFVTLGTSLKADIVAEVGDTGANEVYVFPAEGDEGTVRPAPQPVLTEHDVAALGRLADVRTVVPRGPVAVSAVSHDGRTFTRNRMTATRPALLADANFSAGRPFRQGRREVVLSPSAASLFEGNLSVGDRIRITRPAADPVNVTVVGILATDGDTSPLGGFGSEPRFYLPTDPFYDIVVESPAANAPQRVYPQVTVVAEPGRTAAVEGRVQRYLDEESDASRLAPSRYRLVARTNEELVEGFERVIDRVTTFVTGIAVIALVVGAIGIMNIMLVSVTERTRQIGIMKSVGAHRRDVLQLFLVEAVLLGGFGAVLGIPVGVVASYGATRYVGLPLVFATEWFGIAVAVGLAVGVLAGGYPAWKATRVDPIDALRRE